MTGSLWSWYAQMECKKDYIQFSWSGTQHIQCRARNKLLRQKLVEICIPYAKQNVYNVIVAIRTLQCSTPWQVADALLLRTLHSRPASSSLVQKLVHVGTGTQISSMDSVHGYKDSLHMSILKFMSPIYTANSWSPSTTAKCNILSIAPTS